MNAISGSDNIIVNLNDKPELQVMFEDLVIPIKLSNDRFHMGMLKRLAKVKYPTAYVYIRVALIHEIFVTRNLYSATDDMPFISRRKWVCENAGFLFKDILIKPVLGTGEVYYKDKLMFVVRSMKMASIICAILIEIMPNLVEFITNNKEIRDEFRK